MVDLVKPSVPRKSITYWKYNSMDKAAFSNERAYCIVGAGHNTRYCCWCRTHFLIYMDQFLLVIYMDQFLLVIYIDQFLLLIYMDQFILLIYKDQFLLLIYMDQFLLLIYMDQCLLLIYMDQFS